MSLFAGGPAAAQTPLVQWAQSAYSVTETDADQSLDLTININPVIPGSNTRGVTVRVLDTSTATQGIDWSFSAACNTLPPGVSTRTCTLTIKGDDLSEASETIKLELLAASTVYDLGSIAITTVTIIDDEPPPYSLSVETSRPTPACGAAVTDASVRPEYALVLTPAPAALTETQYRVVGTTHGQWEQALSIETNGRTNFGQDGGTFAKLRETFPGFKGFDFRLKDTPAITAQCRWTFDLDDDPGGDDPGGDDPDDTGIPPGPGDDDPDDPGTSGPGLSAPEHADRSFRENLGDALAQEAMNVGAPVAATGASPGESLQYTLEGADREAFTIDADTGQLRTRPEVLYDYEQDMDYAVVVRASTATASVTTEVAITLIDVAEVPLPPQAPQVRAAANDDTALAIAWTAPPNAGRPAITSYGVRHRAGSGAWQAGPVPLGATRTQLTGLAPDTRYQVQVRAMNADGYGPWSGTGRGFLGMIVDAHEVEGWLVRFGRTVSDQVLEAAGDRFTASRTGFTAHLAGLDLKALRTREMAWQDERVTLLGAGRTLTWAEALSGASFSYTAATGAGGQASFWGRGALTRFDGEDGALRLDGEAVTGLLGADLVRGPLRAGLILSHSDGDGEYRSPTEAGDLDADMTGLYPWVHRTLGERLSVWGLAGYGEGEIRFKPDGGTALKADTDLRMASAGVRGVLQPGEAGSRPELALTSDGLYVRTESDAVGQALAGTSGELTRLRLALEGTWHVPLASGAQLRPTVQAGVRHDGGDAESGFGADLATGLAWEDPQRGLRASVRARGLLTHEDSGFQERGLAASLAWDPRPASAAGWSMTLKQTVGAFETGSLEALLHPDAASRLASNDERERTSQRRRLEATLGYGVLHARGQLVGTPHAALALSDTAREVGLGWRLDLARRNALHFGLELQGTRQEPRTGDRTPEHRLQLHLRAHW